jgi:DNA polymerase-3 subunit alpha
MERIDDVLRAGQSIQSEKETNQISLFGGSAAAREIPRRQSNRAEWPVNQKLAFEREALGFYISGHPLEKFKRELKRLGAITTAELKTFKGKRDADVRVGGVVTALKLKNTKKGDRYATFTLEDWLGTIESIVWPDTYREIAHLIVADDPVLVRGRPDITEERATFIIEKMESLIAIRDKSATQGLLALNEDDRLEEHLDPLLRVFHKYTGSCPVKVRLEIDGAEVSLQLKDRAQAPVCVLPSEALCDEVEQLFGRPVLSFV